MKQREVEHFHGVQFEATETRPQVLPEGPLTVELFPYRLEKGATQLPSLVYQDGHHHEFCKDHGQVFSRFFRGVCENSNTEHTHKAAFHKLRELLNRRKYKK
jgi:hypothetical protein